MIPLARGIYRYARDGVTQPIDESWQLSRDGQRLRLRGQRLRDGEPLFGIDAVYEGARCMELRLSWLTGKLRSVEYRHQGRAIEWQEGDEKGVLRLSMGGLLFPLLRPAMGLIVLQLAESPGIVVVPSLHASAHAAFLRPESTYRRTTLLGDRYRYCGGEYGEEGCECWIDERGLLLRYVWKTPTGTWDVQLQDLAADPAFAGFR